MKEFLINNNITGITEDASLVRPGFIFVAVKGKTSDGHDYIDEAIKKGAHIIVMDENYVFKNKAPQIIKSANTKKTLCSLAECFYKNPSDKLKVIGITGTNGKTSTCYFLYSILKQVKFKPAVMGTLGYGALDNLAPSSHTTMEPEKISQVLHDFYMAGITHVIMEVSSHALSLNRVEAINFSHVGFTNLSQDHLDFHGDLISYKKAKARLFNDLSSINTKKILPIDHGFNILDKKNLYIFDESILVPIEIHNLSLFHVKNARLAKAIALTMGIKEKDIDEGLKNCPPIPGRLELVKTINGLRVFIDFAHTADALKNALLSLKALKPKKLIIVFGAGGDRDKEKRPLMGEVASQLADQLIITDDNPRSEDPKIIRKNIIAGIDKKYHLNITEIPDRKEAINKAILNADKEDIILIAGKGHETYQIYGDEKKFFNDKLIAQEVLNLI